MATSRLRIGTRGSALARWQAGWVAEQLTALGHDVELVPITTRGDAETTVSIGSIGTTGVFTKELQRALLDDRIDVAVHSLKDLPTDVVEGLVLAAVPEREDNRDALVSAGGTPFSELRPGAVVGTGSLRRRAQLLHARPDLQMAPLRGNVDTRLEKLAAGQFDAIVLAQAGLKRLGLERHITELLDPQWMLPAVGQGALGIEARAADRTILDALAPLDHALTHAAVLAERSLLLHLAGGCLAPIGAWARAERGGALLLDAVVLSPDGTRRIADRAAAEPGDAVELGEQVAARLIEAGARELIDQARSVE